MSFSFFFWFMVTMTIMTMRYPLIFGASRLVSLGFKEAVQDLSSRDETVALTRLWEMHRNLICVSFITCTLSWICIPQSRHEISPSYHFYRFIAFNIMISPLDLSLALSLMKRSHGCTAVSGFFGVRNPSTIHTRNDSQLYGHRA